MGGRWRRGRKIQFPPVLFVREWGTLPEIDPADPKALIYQREARPRARQRGARVPLQKKDSDRQQDKN